MYVPSPRMLLAVAPVVNDRPGKIFRGMDRRSKTISSVRCSKAVEIVSVYPISISM